MKSLAIIQARSKSSRFPRKVLRRLSSGDLVLEFLIRRLQKSTELSDVVVATTVEVEDGPIEELCRALGVSCFRGSETDVLSRYAECANEFQAEIVVRITADCPLVDPCMIDDMIRQFKIERLDYLCNQDPPRLPDGLDIDIFSRNLLDFTNSTAIDPYDREHVTPFMKSAQGFNIGQFHFDGDFSQLRVTLDEPQDLDVINEVMSLHDDPNAMTTESVIRHLLTLDRSGSTEDGSEASQMSRGAKLYKTAKRIIPGGNSLLSKRPEMFLPEKWPNYFDRASGIRIWDLDDNMLVDMCIMGIGTNVLGYANPAVDAAVRLAVTKSNMSTLNPPEEVFLADRLLELHPWFDQARFARTGAEANALALRIARVASGKTKVAVCGYHGWHDWYLALNISAPSHLNEHLLRGLSSNGVPEGLGREVTSFRYNNFEEMRACLSDPEVGVIFMEVMRSEPPLPQFLEEIREIATKNGQVLIFDECTSGFRETFGGLHSRFNVFPDMSVFGKALGNGYAITAVLGIESVMASATATFMSSTFWSERIGFAAGLATLNEMERQESWKVLGPLGAKMKEQWVAAFKPLDEYLQIRVTGIDALAAFGSPHPDFMALKTLITQEMLTKHSILASNIFYPSTEHTEDDILDFGAKLGELTNSNAQRVIEGDLAGALEGEIAHAHFSRLN